MAKRGPVEREFGVPFPGEILAEQRWSRTALKRLPSEGTLDWETVYGRRAPVVLDLGCGNGRFVIGSALSRPDHDHLELDALPVVIRYATKRANQRGLTNIRFAVGNAEQFLRNLVEPGSVREIHVYHPQPYHDPGNEHLRLVTPEFFGLIHRSLEPQGRFVIQTDNRAYWNYVRKIAPPFFEFHIQAGAWPDAPLGRTRREIMARQQRLEIFRGWGNPRGNLDEAGIAGLVDQLPSPQFTSRP